MNHITHAEIVNAAGELVTKFAGTLVFDPSKDRDEGYGSADDVKAIAAAVDNRGRGLSLKWVAKSRELHADGKGLPIETPRIEPIVVRNFKMRPSLVWFHIVPKD